MERDIIKQIKSKKKEKIKFDQPLFYRLAYIITKENDKINKLIENNIVEEIEKKLLNNEIKIKEKKEIPIPPFYLPNQEIFEIIKKIEPYQNPYMKYAYSLEEICASIPLWQLDKKISEDIIKKYDLSTLLTIKIANKLLNEQLKQKEKLESILEQINKKKYEFVSEKLTEIIKVNYYAKNKDEFKKFIEDLIEETKKYYIIKKIEEDFDIEVEELNKEKIIKNILKKLENKNIYENFKIDKKQLKVLMYYGNIEKFIKQEFDKYFDEINNEINNIINNKINKNLIGKKVKIFPGDGYKYDYGGTIKDMPAGSERIVKEIKIITTGEKIEKWIVSPREIEKSITCEEISQYVNDIIAKLAIVKDKIRRNKEYQDEEEWTVSPREIEKSITCGEKVKIFPGDGYKYDYGGTIKDMPAGSERIVKEIKIITTGEKIEKWIVSPREINPLSILTNKYKNLVDAILNRDYEKIVDEVIKEETKQIQNQIKNCEKLIKYLKDFENIHKDIYNKK